jgi:hypothetical protein
VNRPDQRLTPEQRAPTPPLGRNRIDAATAQGLKFSTSKKSEPAPAPAAQYLGSAVSATLQGYHSNSAAPQDTYSNHQFAKQQPPPYQRGFDEVTVDSDWDHTKSDLGFDPEDDSQYRQEEDVADERGYAAQADQRFSLGMPQHHLRHVHSQQALVVNPDFNIEHEQAPGKPQTSGKHSRFQPPQQQHSDLQLRIGQAANSTNQQVVASKKRPRENYHRQQERDDEELEDTDESQVLPSHMKDRQDIFEGSSDGGETPGASPTHQRKARLAPSSQLIGDGFAPAPTPAPADYDNEKLKGMKYSDLKSEDWDTIPNQKLFELPPQLQGKPLGDQIAHYAFQPTEELALFYEHLSTSEWEEAGDLLIEKFADLLKRLKAKRQEKRKLTEGFEAKIEAREKAVRGKSDLLAKKLDEMKASGEGVLRGKMV